MLAHVVLNHVPVEGYCFRNKCVYMTHIVRRVLKTVIDRSLLDDKVSISSLSFPIYIHTHIHKLKLATMTHINITHQDYYGNKRLELAGSLISLLFEDLFKRFNTDLKRQADMVLSKPNRATSFDVIKFMRADTITQGVCVHV